MKYCTYEKSPQIPVLNLGVTCGPGCTLILHRALATWPVSAAIPNASAESLINDIAPNKKSDSVNYRFLRLRN
ncbi:hypothetical protein [Mucilaginibacter rubeus]|uniref:Uncharacterized protein n=1 Tax=Mucilaginibacter rubeus TaxID=2027860 RepID=A0A5C1HX58_9SPHI|nr:hypothetical protein [Mucilaginibacter rubeus]QEM10225.1 hypothetical protein DEO27_009365 [Mucilaginibacter rubeus]